MTWTPTNRLLLDESGRHEKSGDRIKQDERHGLYIVQSGRALADLPEHDRAWAGTAGRATMRRADLKWSTPRADRAG